MTAPERSWVIAANMLLGVNQGLVWAVHGAGVLTFLSGMAAWWGLRSPARA